MKRSSQKLKWRSRAGTASINGAPCRDADVVENSLSAFTLVELLIAMAIFVTLATIAVSAWRGTEQDRVSNAAAIFKNALEGAKSRALKSGENRGLRLIIDPNNGRAVTSLVYVDGGRFVTGKLVAEFDNRGTGTYSSNPTSDTGPPAYNPVSSGRWRVACADVDQSLWTTYQERGLIGPGTLIEIPTGQSNWMRFTGKTELDSGGNTWWVLGPGILVGELKVSSDSSAPANGRDNVTYGAPNPADLTGSGLGLPTAFATEPLDYRMQLMPTILAGSEPISLPANTCIDLDGSKIPQSWRPLLPNKSYYGPESGFMDIVFSPRGGLNRPLTTEGLLHFRVGSIGDLLLAQGSGLGLPNDASQPVVLTDAEHGGKLVSIITQTGIVLNADVYPSIDSGNGPNNEAYNFNSPPSGSVLNPYYYVLYGKESK